MHNMANITTLFSCRKTKKNSRICVEWIRYGLSTTSFGTKGLWSFGGVLANLEMMLEQFNNVQKNLSQNPFKVI